MDISRPNEKYSSAITKVDYTLDYGPFSEIVTFLCLTDNQVELLVKNENISSTLTVIDSNIYCNGRNISASRNRAAITRSSEYVYQSNCPYGSASDYSYYLGLDSNVNIQLSDKLENTTYTIVLALIGFLNIAGAVVATFTAVAYLWLVDNSPNSQYLSYKDYKYWHYSCGPLSGGYISNFGAYVTKHNVYWYSEKNFGGGDSTFSTQYEIRYIY